jgi:hypothetical protein
MEDIMDVLCFDFYDSENLLLWDEYCQVWTEITGNTNEPSSTFINDYLDWLEKHENENAIWYDSFELMEEKQRNEWIKKWKKGPIKDDWDRFLQMKKDPKADWANYVAWVRWKRRNNFE